MRYFRYVNNACQGWQSRDWMKLSDSCPYHYDHAAKMHQPEFVRESLFRFYCSNTRGLTSRHRRYSHAKVPKRGGSTYRHGKLYKLYWALHPSTPQLGKDTK